MCVCGGVGGGGGRRVMTAKSLLQNSYQGVAAEVRRIHIISVEKLPVAIIELVYVFACLYSFAQLCSYLQGLIASQKGS